MNANSPAPFPLSHSEIFLARGHLRLLTTSDNCRGSSRKLTAAALRRNPGVTYKTGRLMCQRLHRGMKGPLSETSSSPCGVTERGADFLQPLSRSVRTLDNPAR